MAVGGQRYLFVVVLGWQRHPSLYDGMFSLVLSLNTLQCINLSIGSFTKSSLLQEAAGCDRVSLGLFTSLCFKVRVITFCLPALNVVKV